MHTAIYLYQLGQLVAVHIDSPDGVEYGHIQQVNIDIYRATNGAVTQSVIYIIQLLTEQGCGKTVRVPQSQVSNVTTLDYDTLQAMGIRIG